MSEWQHPGGPFVVSSSLCGRVLYNWHNKAKSHGKFNPEDTSVSQLPSRGGGQGHNVGNFIDPVCKASEHHRDETIAAKFFSNATSKLDFSMLSVGDEADTEIGSPVSDIRSTVSSGAHCRQHKTSQMRPDGFRLECERIPSGTPSQKVKGRWCTCNNGKWHVGKTIGRDGPRNPSQPVPSPSPANNNNKNNKRRDAAGQMTELVANAQMLCTIVDAIDCWQETAPAGGGDQKTPGWWPFSTSTKSASASGGVHVTAHRGEGDAEAQFVADPKQLLGHVRQICNVIDRGTDNLLNELMEEFGLKDMVRDAIKEHIKKQLPGGLVGKIGSGVLDKILDGKKPRFMDIFAVHNGNKPHVDGEGSIEAQSGAGIRIAVVASSRH